MGKVLVIIIWYLKEGCHWAIIYFHCIGISVPLRQLVLVFAVCDVVQTSVQHLLVFYMLVVKSAADQAFQRVSTAQTASRNKQSKCEKSY